MIEISRTIKPDPIHNQVVEIRYKTYYRQDVHQIRHTIDIDDIAHVSKFDNEVIHAFKNDFNKKYANKYPDVIFTVKGLVEVTSYVEYDSGLDYPVVFNYVSDTINPKYWTVSILDNSDYRDNVDKVTKSMDDEAAGVFQAAYPGQDIRIMDT